MTKENKMTALRDYQRRAIDQLYQWFSDGRPGNPCIEMPTGSGKSHVVAALCREAVETWPETRILMLTHVKELIEQNAEKMLQHWPDAPLGIYSAGVGRRDIGKAITFAGIQSLRDKADIVGHIDLLLIDECHLVSHKQQGSYRNLIDSLIDINPKLRVIGLTATPFRLGHGLITDDSALFSDILRPVSIEELVARGFLAPLRSKLTAHQLSVAGVGKRGGEYIARDLQAAVDTKNNNERVVDEVISLAGDRRSWLFFCAGVKHAHHIAEILESRGITAATITGKTPKKEREKIISDFKAGRIRALTNANVLTTGFDHPDLDLIAMLRATESAGLYVQCAGRGMRKKSHTDHCLVLDFAGVVQRHGPITAVQPGKPPAGGEPPVKACEACQELNQIAARICVACGNPFPISKPPERKLHNDDIMGLDDSEIEVTEWEWKKHVSRTSGKEMLKVTYFGCLSDPPIDEYLPVTHGGYAGKKAISLLTSITKLAGADDALRAIDLDSAADILTNSAPPAVIAYRQDGKFFRVKNRKWDGAGYVR